MRSLVDGAPWRSAVLDLNLRGGFSFEMADDGGSAIKMEICIAALDTYEKVRAA
jgi:hypothetical protein